MIAPHATSPPPAAKSPWPRRALWACVVLAAVARLAMLAFAASHPTTFDYPDSRRYVDVARNIAAGLGPIDSPEVRCGTDPLYPYMLSIAPRLGIRTLEGIMNWGRVVNALAGLLALPAVAILGRRVGGAWGAVVAAGIYAVDPITLFFHGLVLTEIAYLACLWWGAECVLRAIESGRARLALIAGAVLAAGTLTRSSGLFLPLMWLPLLSVRAPARKTTDAASTQPTDRAAPWRALTAFVLAYAAVLAPTAIRNYTILGHWVPVRTGLGATLLDGNGPWATGASAMDRIVYPAYPPAATEYDRERMNRQAATRWIAENPGRFAELAWIKFRRTWSITLSAPGYGGLRYDVICYATVLPVFVLAALGLLWVRPRPMMMWLLLAPALYFSVVHCVFVGSVRYRVPLMPAFFILAAAAVSHVIERQQSRRARRAHAEPRR